MFQRPAIKSLFVRAWSCNRVEQMVLTTGPASLDNSCVSALKPTGTSAQIRRTAKQSLHEEGAALRARVSMVHSLDVRCCSPAIHMWSTKMRAADNV